MINNRDMNHRLYLDVENGFCIWTLDNILNSTEMGNFIIRFRNEIIIIFTLPKEL